MTRRPRPVQISDAALDCFIRWVQMNDPELVGSPGLARRVLNAYAAVPDPEPAELQPAALS